MTSHIILTVLLGVAAVAALYIAWRLNRMLAYERSRVADEHLLVEKGLTELAACTRERDDLRTRLVEAQHRADATATRLAESERLLAAAESRLTQMGAERERNEEMLRTQFANLANDILRANSSQFKSESEERLAELLRPLRDNIDTFRRQVSDAYSAESRERFSLEKAIASLAEMSRNVEREAHDLSTALRGSNNVQGDWGEVVLESILEKSGLRKGVEYDTQVNLDDEGRKLRNEDGTSIKPDVVIRYPDRRCLVIDSKVSLSAYLDYVNTDDAEKQKGAVTRHLISVKGHVDRLSKKKYQEAVGSDKLDFVMMFIPNEPAYMLALRSDPSLWQYAYDRNVLIVSPTHLVSAMRLIEQLWSRDKVTKNAQKIATDAGKMYDKLAGFVESMKSIGDYLTKAQGSYKEAMNRLNGPRASVIKQANDLRALGVTPKKTIILSSDPTDGDEEDVKP